ncbi:glycosyltransferase family 4 protein [Candidatus Uhrbacteria bacterium]|jgi:glycosyltransferase involved in cell wall biosynthesis|nr:glycosyltransferase family 4 protein [Candidatus Uhrbacteria bacterium]
MSKILLPTLDYPPRTGGVARYLSAIKDTLGDDIEVLFFEDVPGRFSMLRTLLQRSGTVEQVWTSHILPIGTMLWLISLVRKIRYSVILHGMDFDLARRSAWKRWLSKRVFKKAEHVFSNTSALAEEIEEFSGRKPVVIYPCIGDAFVEASSIVRRENHDGIRLLTVARLVERKGHMDVLRIVNLMPELHYTIVGDGVMRKEMQEYIDQNDLADRVEILRSVPDRKLPSIYSKSDIFVMPTHKSNTDREGFGIVYLEAQLFGTPVIAVSHPGVDEAVIDGVGGILLADKEGLESAIKKLASDDTLRSEMGVRAQKFVKERFTRDKQFSIFKEYV